MFEFQESFVIARKPPASDPPRRGAAKPASPRKRTAPVAAVPAPPGTPRKKAAAAGPAKPAVRRAAPKKLKPEDSSKLDVLQKAIMGSLEDDKAENIVAIDLAGRASFADRMVIATGLADRQIAAMAQHLEEKLHENGIGRVQIEGAGGSDWVLIDAGDIVVHLFRAEAREAYALEKMWGSDFEEEAPAGKPEGESG